MKKIAFGMAGLLLALSVLCAQAEEPADISIIGGADGPTSIFLAGKLSDRDTKDAAQRLYALKTAYVGDAPAVGAILTELSELGYFPSAGFSLEIHSDQEPYGLTVSFTEAPQDLLTAECSLANAGNLLLALIENLSEAEFTYPVEGQETPAHLYVNLETAKLALDGGDVREYGKSPETFAELLQYPAAIDIPPLPHSFHK